MSIWYFHFFLLQSDVNSCLFIFISFSEFEIKTLKGLEQIKTQVNYNTSLLLQIIKKVDVQQTVDAEDNDDNELPVLPIKTMLQLEGVENALKVDTTKNRLVSNIPYSTCMQKLWNVMIFFLLPWLYRPHMSSG